MRFNRGACPEVCDRLDVSHREAPIASGESRVDINGLLKEPLRENVVLRSEFVEMPQAALIGRPSIEVPRWLSYGPSELGIEDGRGDRDRHSLRDIVLHREDVGEIAVIAFSPDVLAGLRLDELPSDTDAIACFTQAAFEDVAHPELAPDLLHVDRTALVGEAGVSRDDKQRGIARERSDNVFSDAVGEELLVGVGAHIDERQHRDRRFVRRRQGSRPLRGIGGSTHGYPIHSHGPYDVLQVLLPDVLKGKVELTRGILLHARRHANAARLSQAFEANCHVHAIPKDVAVLDYDVSHIDANPEIDALVRRYRRIPFGHLSLYLSGTVQRIHYAAELGEKAVTRRLDEPAVMRSDLRIEHLFADRLESLESAPLVRPDQPRVSGHISGEDRGETAGRAHSSGNPALRSPSTHIASVSGAPTNAPIVRCHPEIVNAGCNSSTRRVHSRASSARSRCAQATAFRRYAEAFLGCSRRLRSAQSMASPKRRAFMFAKDIPTKNVQRSGSSRLRRIARCKASIAGSA